MDQPAPVSAPRPLPGPTALVVPCHDEARRLDVSAWVAFLEAQPALHLVMVDDGSTDDTGAILRRLAAEHDRIVAVHLSPNQGKAEAVRTGMALALADDRFAYAGYWDADLATPLVELPRFAHHLADHPELVAVMGSRVKVLGAAIARHPARHYLGRVAATLASWVLRLPVYDTQCGAKLFRVGDEARALFGDPFLTRWTFDVEILARLIARHPHRSRAELEDRVHELPLRRWTDVPDSRITLADVLTAPLDLWRIWRHHRPERHGRLGSGRNLPDDPRS